MADAIAAIAGMDPRFVPSSLSAEEWERIGPILLADQQMRHAEQAKRFAAMGYLVKHAPGASSVGIAIEQLSESHLAGFREIVEREVQDFDDWSVVEEYLDD
ncbi:MAG: hypothetical protein JWO62_588 [Acidimicrobiaceae bacterium]|nr:hypothetical protein [Acidimicrobiaceae bacterium]